MTLTKTGFLQYGDCAKAHWVRINRPGEMPPSPPNAFVQMLMREGYEVEALARSLIETWPDTMLIILPGIKNGETRRGPFSANNKAVSWMPEMPPMPANRLGRF